MPDYVPRYSCFTVQDCYLKEGEPFLGGRRVWISPDDARDLYADPLFQRMDERPLPEFTGDEKEKYFGKIGTGVHARYVFVREGEPIEPSAALARLVAAASVLGADVRIRRLPHSVSTGYQIEAAVVAGDSVLLSGAASSTPRAVTALWQLAQASLRRAAGDAR